MSAELAVTVTLAHPLSAEDAAAVGLPAASLGPGATVTLPLASAERLVTAGMTTINPADRSAIEALFAAPTFVVNNAQGEVYIGPTLPRTPAAAYLWVQTGLGTQGRESALWIDDGAGVARVFVAGDLTATGDLSVVNGVATISPALLPSTTTLRLTRNTQIAFGTGFPATRSGTVTVILKQAANGGPFQATWPSTLEWAGDAPPPVMPTAVNAELLVHLFWTGASWRAVVAGVFNP